MSDFWVRAVILVATAGLFLSHALEDSASAKSRSDLAASAYLFDRAAR